MDRENYEGLREEALAYLRKGLSNEQVDFRAGQWEAIEGVLRGRRQLIVQRTGWGKSMVYFLAAKFLREWGRGMTLLVSPLLALMRNQIEAAGALGLRVRTINSTNFDEWGAVTREVVGMGVDLLLVSPERLSNEEFQSRVLDQISDRVGLFVVDEAHCISDWGHDFRPDYKRISRILKNLPRTMPVLATTATANLRVCEDIKGQLGEDLAILRGPLERESLYLQNLQFANDEEKLVWLAETLKERIQGCGIVYTLTTIEAENVAKWLRSQGITAFAYFSNVEPSPEMPPRMQAAFEASLAEAASEDRSNAYRIFLENALLRNRIRVLVASCALGMGFDKPDLSFVIHYQRPKSVVDYYQQVGRAGRNIAQAYGILLAERTPDGTSEDDRIANYFIQHAFPTQENVEILLQAIKNAPNGLSRTELLSLANMRQSALEQVLKFLTTESPQPVVLSDRKYRATPFFEAYRFPFERVDRIKGLRFAERDRMRQYVESQTCLMKFLCDELDSPLPQGTCGKCAHCDPSRALPSTVNAAKVPEAARFLMGRPIPLIPRKQWADVAQAAQEFELAQAKRTIPAELAMCEGRILCLYNVGFFGKLVAYGKYKAHPPRFDDRLVAGVVSMVKTWQPDPSPQWVTAIPSQRTSIVEEFARRVAVALGLPYRPALTRTSAVRPQQKTMQNSAFQQRNVVGAFALEASPPRESCLLIDDMTDSRWTLTIAAAMLRKAGVSAVFPLALAKSSNAQDN